MGAPTSPAKAMEAWARIQTCLKSISHGRGTSEAECLRDIVQAEAPAGLIVELCKVVERAERQGQLKFKGPSLCGSAFHHGKHEGRCSLCGGWASNPREVDRDP